MLQTFLHAGFQDFRGTAVSKLLKGGGLRVQGFRVWGLGLRGFGIKGLGFRS